MASTSKVVEQTLLGKESAPSTSIKASSTFDKHASLVEEDGKKYMSIDDFTNAIAPGGMDYHKIGRDQYKLLFKVADRSETGRVSLTDWGNFSSLLAKPDAEYEIAFRLFDIDGNGSVSFDEFLRMYNENKTPSPFEFDWGCNWVNLYMGSGKKRHEMSYPQFSQMLRGLQGERVRQAFHFYDPKNTGFIAPDDFATIIRSTSGHKLSDHLLDNLHTLCNISTSSKISYPQVRAFQNVVRELDMVTYIAQSATSKTNDHHITRAEFLDEAARVTRFSLFTPLEVDILFHFASLDANDNSRLNFDDFARVLDPSWVSREDMYARYIQSSTSAAKNALSSPREFLSAVFESAYHFGLGSIAGALGATIVYPIDLVKTRMQNQRNVVGERLYASSIDCARKVISNEGLRGMYSGLGPQLVGVAPEKAIKLTINDLVRGKSRDDRGNIALSNEILAGAMAGGCQVIFTNPLEIVKIRLQVQGEVAKNVEGVTRRSALWIVRNLGLVGLYKGATACLMRDIPFSAIYFPTYAHLKKEYFGEGPTKTLGILQLLTAGAVAGMPAAALTTPADVIKTRLQVAARKGQTTYSGVLNCAKTVFLEEGLRAFFKGAGARVLRSSPQFGATLAAYEVLERLLPLPGHTPSNAPSTQLSAGGSTELSAPMQFLRSKNALKIILDLDQNFGRVNIPGREAKSWRVPGLGRESYAQA